jgi:hypothetical protein
VGSRAWVARLRTGVRTLGGALAGVATVGGLTALVDRSLSAADAIGETASKIGIGVEALQELRFAASPAGVEQQTLDMALQRFTRRAAEAAQGTGEAEDALAQMGIALRDQSGNLAAARTSSPTSPTPSRIEDPAERVRLAFKLFNSIAIVRFLAVVGLGGHFKRVAGQLLPLLGLGRLSLQAVCCTRLRVARPLQSFGRPQTG